MLLELELAGGGWEGLVRALSRVLCNKEGGIRKLGARSGYCAGGRLVLRATTLRTSPINWRWEQSSALPGRTNGHHSSLNTSSSQNAICRVRAGDCCCHWVSLSPSTWCGGCSPPPLQPFCWTCWLQKSLSRQCLLFCLLVIWILSSPQPAGCNQEQWNRTESGPAEPSLQLSSRHWETDPATPRGDRDESWREGGREREGLDQSGLLGHMTVIPSISHSHKK